LLLAGESVSAQPAGAPAEAVDYPYVAALSREAGSGPVFFCAGTLIAPRWIATAAHCFFGRDGQWIGEAGLSAVVGRDRLDALDKAARIGIDRVVLHPGYEPASQDSDIALVRLEAIAGPLIAAPARGGDDGAGPWIALGFGSFYEGRLAGNALSATGAPTSQASYRLRQAPLRPAEPASCASLASLGKAEDARQLCARAAPADACVGDSGGPLVVSLPGGEERLLGILSIGTGCAVPMPALAYTRVADHAEWIAAVTNGQ
jgi:secreted trypsin-like serine protease